MRHTTSMPLDLAYKAVQLTAPYKAEHFLYLLRYATIVNTRPTTHFDEILKVVHEAGIDVLTRLRIHLSGTVRFRYKTDL